MKFSLILGLFACFSIALAEHETLVLVDNLNIKETHSQFFKSLQGKKSIENATQDADAGSIFH